VILAPWVRQNDEARDKLFLNLENLGQCPTEPLDPTLLPTALVDGRWTVDAWAPLDGRVINAAFVHVLANSGPLLPTRNDRSLEEAPTGAYPPGLFGRYPTGFSFSVSIAHQCPPTNVFWCLHLIFRKNPERRAQVFPTPEARDPFESPAGGRLFARAPSQGCNYRKLFYILEKWSRVEYSQ